MSRNTNLAERKRETAFLILIILGIITGAVIGVDAGREYQKRVDMSLNITGKPDFSFFTRENALVFCKQHGYTGAWMSCIIDAGFTCSDSTISSKSSSLKTTCYSIQDLYDWQYQR